MLGHLPSLSWWYSSCSHNEMTSLNPVHWSLLWLELWSLFKVSPSVCQWPGYNLVCFPPMARVWSGVFSSHGRDVARCDFLPWPGCGQVCLPPVADVWPGVSPCHGLGVARCASLAWPWYNQLVSPRHDSRIVMFTLWRSRMTSRFRYTSMIDAEDVLSRIIGQRSEGPASLHWLRCLIVIVRVWVRVWMTGEERIFACRSVLIYYD